MLLMLLSACAYISTGRKYVPNFPLHKIRVSGRQLQYLLKSSLGQELNLCLSGVGSK